MKSRLLSCFSLPFLFVSALGQSTTVVAPIMRPNTSAVAGQSATSSVTDYSGEPIVIEQ
jgi:hypothetical protein